MNGQKKKQNSLILVMGVLSSVLLLSGFGSLFFLLPIVYVAIRFGRKALFLSSLISVVLFSGITFGIAGLTELATYSVILTIALLLCFNIIAQSKLRNFVYRILLSAVLLIPVAQIVIPAILNNETLKSTIIEQLNALLVTNELELSGKTLYNEAIAIFAKVNGASLVVFLFLNAWLGGAWFINRRYRNFINVIVGASEAIKSNINDIPSEQNGKESVNKSANEELLRLAQKINEEQQNGADLIFPYDLKTYFVPQVLIWLLLAVWAFLLISLKVQFPIFILNLAWNCAIVVSFSYLFQGLAVVYTRLSLLPAAPAARLGFTIILILLVVGGAVSLVVSILLILIGTLETWIRLRPIKGV
ncbi:MAG TPA: hypothetical protein P5519_11070 [Spirochaetia bacterium]|nr:hypothetical protein [Spirochaetales bacterium]HPD79530.1 hypothetical protein [Spirochaetales bacterium]HRS66412.1 hypothetical protein [Spirochaetia bacterium]HRV27238.1 hypothetical protein [Spirochaetia bacterium]